MIPVALQPQPQGSPPQPPPAAPRKWGSGPVPISGAGKKKWGEGSSVNHPKYGRGTIVRKEGDGEDAKLTVMFPGHGLKKIIAKFAGFTS